MDHIKESLSYKARSLRVSRLCTTKEITLLCVSLTLSREKAGSQEQKETMTLEKMRETGGHFGVHTKPVWEKVVKGDELG